MTSAMLSALTYRRRSGDVVGGVVARRPVCPQRLPESGFEQRRLGQSDLLDEPDVERPLELAVAEHPAQAPRSAERQGRRSDRRPSGVGRNRSVPGVRAPVVSDRARRVRRRGMRRMDVEQMRTYVPTLIGLPVGAAYPGSHGATTRYPRAARVGPRCRQVYGVSGKPWTRTARGTVVSSMSPNESGCGSVTR